MYTHIHAHMYAHTPQSGSSSIIHNIINIVQLLVEFTVYRTLGKGIKLGKCL